MHSVLGLEMPGALWDCSVMTSASAGRLRNRFSGCVDRGVLSAKNPTRSMHFEIIDCPGAKRSRLCQAAPGCISVKWILSKESNHSGQTCWNAFSTDRGRIDQRNGRRAAHKRAAMRVRMGLYAPAGIEESLRNLTWYFAKIFGGWGSAFATLFTADVDA
jgi:hypothetical protein